MSNFIIKITNLSYSYNKNDEVLDNINLSFIPGKFYAILGPNGSGKSTLLKCINRFLEVNDGKIVLNNQNYDEEKITNIGLNDLAKEISYIPQQLLPTSLNVFDYVMLGRRPHITFSPNLSDYQHCSNAIDMLELNNLSLKKFDELSGGEQQSASIARAFAQNTNIMLFDEPTNNLDVKKQHTIFNKIKSKMQNKNLTVICVLHDINQAITYADEVIFMKSGKVVENGSPKIITEKLIKKVYEVEAKIFNTQDKKYVFI